MSNFNIIVCSLSAKQIDLNVLVCRSESPLSWVIKSFITRLNILQHDFYVVVPVRAGLFMVESQSMEQLMLDGAMVKAATTGQRHHLLTTTTANVGVAAEKYQRFELNNTEV